MKIANLAYCGLLCSGCPIHWVSKEPDEGKRSQMKIEIARIYNEKSGINLSPLEITQCDGCKAEDGKRFGLSKDCPIRTCARQKKFDTCAQCEIYPCKNLEEIFRSDSSARSRLDVLRAGMG